MTSSGDLWRWRPVAIAIAILALALTGVRGADAATGRTAVPSKVAAVKIVNFAFRPATLTVAKGDRVTFSNSGSVTHTATSGGAFDTGLVKPGKSVTVRFKQKGSFPYHCKIHPSMRGKIVVD